MVVIWHLSVIQNSKFTLISGVAMNMTKSLKKESRVKNFISIPASYLKDTYANQVIHIKTIEHSIKSLTDNYGTFQIKLKGKTLSKIQILDVDMNEVSINQNYPVLFEQKETGRLVISDIDDTIMVSFTKTKVKRFITTLFKPASKRKVIAYTHQLYRDIGHDADFFYVSKSENNLFHLITDFILHNNLPLGPLFLTPFLNFTQLIKEKKNGSFKFLSICFILDHSKNKSVILIGDDTQSDMKIYTDIITKYGKRVEKVYIRQTKANRTEDQINHWDRLVKTGVNAFYFKHDELFKTLN
jgi:phosphatidate phosphatase APP1